MEINLEELKKYGKNNETLGEVKYSNDVVYQIFIFYIFGLIFLAKTIFL